MMRTRLLFAVVLVVAGGCHRDDQPSGSAAGSPPAPRVTAAPASSASSDSLEPADLAAQLAGTGDKPLLFHVGFDKLYQQAHIPGSEYLGPTSDDAAIAKLRTRVADLPRTTAIVLYCGCCPWDHCPNVQPAFHALHDLGFTNVKMLHMEHDFGADWVDHGYPVATGA